MLNSNLLRILTQAEPERYQNLRNLLTRLPSVSNYPKDYPNNGPSLDKILQRREIPQGAEEVTKGPGDEQPNNSEVNCRTSDAELTVDVIALLTKRKSELWL